MRHIRKIEDHSVILAYGYVAPGGLREFNPAIWEEVEGEPVAGAQLYTEKPLAEKLNEQYNQLPVEKRVQYGTLKAAIRAFLEQSPPDIEAAQNLIGTAEIPTEDEPIRQALLALFPAD